MEALKLNAGSDTPSVAFDPGKGEMMISGRSLPEDAVAFYQPLIEWLLSYSKKPAAASHFIFDLEYFNTSSARQLFKVLTVIKEISNAEIIWYYDEDDTDMKNSGERYAKLCGLQIEIKIKPSPAAL